MSNSMEKAPKPLSEADRQAALDLARGNKLLMSDAFTADVIKRGGKTSDGRVIEDIGNFLAEREAELAKHPGGLAAGPRKEDKLYLNVAVLHSKRWEEKESHED